MVRSKPRQNVETSRVAVRVVRTSQQVGGAVRASRVSSSAVSKAN
jgi:hypothetical protein